MRWRRRKNKPRARRRSTPAMQPMTIPAIAPPDRPLEDGEAAAAEAVAVLEARKTVVVGAGVDIAIDEDV